MPFFTTEIWDLRLNKCWRMSPSISNSLWSNELQCPPLHSIGDAQVSIRHKNMQIAPLAGLKKPIESRKNLNQPRENRILDAYSCICCSFVNWDFHAVWQQILRFQRSNGALLASRTTKRHSLPSRIFAQGYENIRTRLLAYLLMFACIFAHGRTARGSPCRSASGGS